MTGKIAEALAAFQAEMPVVAKSHTAKVPTKAGGQYSYTYADLADVTEAAMPLLSKQGLSFSCLPDAGVLRGVLLHTSGETLEGALPIEGRTPQEIGSSLTYMRRYLLGCLTGIVTDDDDDGSIASQPAKRTAAKKATKPPPSVDASSGRPVLPADAPMQANTRGAMFALFNELGIDEPAQKAGIEHIIGRQIESRGELKEAEARQVVDKLRQKQREKASA